MVHAFEFFSNLCLYFASLGHPPFETYFGGRHDFQKRLCPHTSWTAAMDAFFGPRGSCKRKGTSICSALF